MLSTPPSCWQLTFAFVICLTVLCPNVSLRVHEFCALPHAIGLRPQEPREHLRHAHQRDLQLAVRYTQGPLLHWNASVRLLPGCLTRVSVLSQQVPSNPSACYNAVAAVGIELDCTWSAPKARPAESEHESSRLSVTWYETILLRPCLT